MHKKKSPVTLSQYSWDNFAQVTTLCNSICGVPGNNVQEKILCKIVLILLGKYCTAENPMQCCPRGSGQFCIKSNAMQCCLNTLGITLHRSKPYAILSERLQTTLHKKTLCNFALMLLGQHCTGQNPMQCCPRGSRQLCIRENLVQCCLNILERLQTTLHKENVPFNINGLCNLGPMQCCYRGPKQHFTAKHSDN